ncbi:MAG: Rne/Rng family ribonuclease [Candidatus Coproplasma sp.]
MNRKIYFDNQCGLYFYALVEDGKLTEYRTEKEADGASTGNIYKGRVTNVLNGMQAAFVDCGLDRHCYVSASDLCPSRSFEGEIDIHEELNLNEGDEIMVQITKPAMGSKGAKATTNLSFVGKYIVYMPKTPFIGVSHKIADGELRDTLILSAKRFLQEDEGMIVRTAAPYALLSAKTEELNYFRNLFNNIQSRFYNAPCGELLYSDSPLYMCVLRDMMFDGGDEIHIGNKRIYESVKAVMSAFPEKERAKIIYHDEHTDMLYSEGIAQEFLKTLQPKAELENGAHIVIDRTEALTVIDVNTGKFTGEDSLESTVFATNVLATREIARQIKLRNLGGLFVVDFIDMKEEKHNKAIVQELECALKKDKSRYKVLPMSKFGLVEFTRKRTGTSNYENRTKPCKACDGTGIIRSAESILLEFRARLLQELSKGVSTVCADLNFEIANYILNSKALKENVARLYPQSRVYIIAHRTYRETTMKFRSVDIPNFTLPEGTMLLY